MTSVEALLEQSKQLSIEERLLLAQLITDSVIAEDSTAVLSKEQQEELDRRLENYGAHPMVGQPWEEVRKEIFRNK